MKKAIFLTVAVLFLTTTHLVWAEGSALSRALKDIAKKRIVAFSKESVIINAVKKANQGHEMTAEGIALLDEKWARETEKSSFISEVLKNQCSDYLREIQANNMVGTRSLYSEILIIDKHGCLVAATKKTSDYWQGDEDKFLKIFEGNKKNLFIDEPKFDDSTQKYSIQISVPIIDSSTKKAMGVITVGIDLDVLTEQNLE